MPSGSLVILYMLRDYSFPFHKMCIIGQDWRYVFDNAWGS